MNAAITIVVALVVLSFLVFIHEGGHYLAARAFRVRVTEFMIGLPGPGISATVGETRFGITAVLLGGYARICGMEMGAIQPHIKPVLGYVYRAGSATPSEIADLFAISEEEAENTLVQLSEWGSVTKPEAKAAEQRYSVPAYAEKRRLNECTEEQVEELYESEYNQLYRSLPCWKRCVIVLAGPAINILFALLVFVLVYSVIGVDVPNPQTGEMVHIILSPLKAIAASFSYIALVIHAVIQLFNPATAAETISQSSSVVGIAVMSKQAFDQGFVHLLFFSAAISASLGIMNLIPILPLDGGRFVIEIFQNITKRPVSERGLSIMTLAGISFVVLLFVVMLFQDIQRFIIG